MCGQGCDPGPSQETKDHVITFDKCGNDDLGVCVPKAIVPPVLLTELPPDSCTNPYKGWNMVWVPYCTGDAFGGSPPNTTVQGVTGTQQFVGYQNMQRFVGHIVPTFPTPERVVLTGTSAGSFGAGLGFNQVQTPTVRSR